MSREKITFSVRLPGNNFYNELVTFRRDEETGLYDDPDKAVDKRVFMKLFQEGLEDYFGKRKNK